MSFQIHLHRCDNHLQQACRNVIDEWTSENVALTFTTSGSTGTPKQITLSKQQIASSAKRSNSYFNLNEKSKVLLCIHPQHVGGKMVLIRALIGDYEVHVVPVQRNFWEYMPEMAFDFVSLVPLQIQAALNQNIPLFQAFKTILIGGSALQQTIEQAVVQSSNIDCAIYMGYGMTETISHIALRKLGQEDYTLLSDVILEAHPTRTHILDKATGVDITCTDVLEMTSKNTFKWVGRQDFVINSGGVKIHPERIEQILTDHIHGNYVIVGLPDELFGEKVVLVTERALSDSARTHIEEIIRTTFGSYAVPKNYLVHSIPTNGVKIMRKQLHNEIRKLE